MGKKFKITSKSKGILKGVIFVAFLLLSLIPFVSSVGLGHQDDLTVFFKPGLKKNVPFYVRNVKEGTELNLSLSGDLAKYGKISKLDEDNEFFVTLQLPEKIQKPGNHRIYVEATEVPKQENGEGILATVTSVRAPITIKVPYPGKYPEIDLDVPDGNVGEPIMMVISVMNFGKKDILTANSSVGIYDINDNKIESFSLGKARINSTEKEKFYAEWKPEKQGEYKARVKLDYDGETKKIEKTFKVGSLFIDITDYTKEIKFGGVRPVEIKVKSNWNDDIDDVYADMLIKNQNNTVSEIKTPSEDISPWGEKILTGYWDINNVSLGEYKVNITVNYENKTTQEIYNIEVVEELSKDQNILVYVVISMIAVMAFWYFKKREIKLKKLKRKNEVGF